MERKITDDTQLTSNVTTLTRKGRKQRAAVCVLTRSTSPSSWRGDAASPLRARLRIRRPVPVTLTTSWISHRVAPSWRADAADELRLPAAPSAAGESSGRGRGGDGSSFQDGEGVATPALRRARAAASPRRSVAGVVGAALQRQPPPPGLAPDSGSRGLLAAPHRRRRRHRTLPVALLLPWYGCLGILGWGAVCPLFPCCCFFFFCFLGWSL